MGTYPCAMEQDPVRREGLGEPIQVVELNDCQLSFRRQVATNDVWCVAAGPLGTFAFRVMEDAALRRIQAGRAARDETRDESSRRRHRAWHHVEIEDDFVIAVRPSGHGLSYALLFGDGAAFGGGESGLPSRRPGMLERVRSKLPGARRDPVRMFRRP
jgi:hypothetical protein